MDTNAQGELASLWMAVQELNKLDAIKEKKLQELLADRCYPPILCPHIPRISHFLPLTLISLTNASVHVLLSSTCSSLIHLFLSHPPVPRSSTYSSLIL